VPDEHYRGTEPARRIRYVGGFPSPESHKVSHQKIMTRFDPSFGSNLKICIDTPE
jgi:hypothetical protein